jgi:hypothetical protein
MRRLPALAFALAIAAIVAAPAAGARDVTVSTSTEAWYASLPPLSARPAGTLHVGVTAGIEDSRTYIALDLRELPSGAEVIGGTLNLPIDIEDSEAMHAAAIDVCAAADPGPSVEGSTDPPPPVDCATHAQARIGTDALSVDLAPFADVLRSGGLALVPIGGGTESWHVAIWGRGNPKHITATTALRDDAPTAPAPAPADDASPTHPAAPVFSAPGTEIAGRAPLAILAPPGRAVARAGAPRLGGGATSLAPAAPSAPDRYADSVVYLLPLVLLAGVGYLGSALTRPISLEPRGAESRSRSVPRRAPRRARAAPEPRASD